MVADHHGREHQARLNKSVITEELFHNLPKGFSAGLMEQASLTTQESGSTMDQIAPPAEPSCIIST
jgi:hypothetical protein